AVLFVAYGMPFAEEGVHGFSTQADDWTSAKSGVLTQTSFLPKLLPEAFYSESYSFLLQGEDGSFARVQFLVSNAGLEGHGGAAGRCSTRPSLRCAASSTARCGAPTGGAGACADTAMPTPRTARCRRTNPPRSGTAWKPSTTRPAAPPH